MPVRVFKEAKKPRPGAELIKGNSTGFVLGVVADMRGLLHVFITFFKRAFDENWYNQSTTDRQIVLYRQTEGKRDRKRRKESVA